MDKKDRQQIIISNKSEDTNIYTAAHIGYIETKIALDLLDYNSDDHHLTTCYVVPEEANQVSSILSNINHMLNDTVLYNMINN